MRIYILIALLLTSVSSAYADEVSAGGGGAGGGMSSPRSIAGPGGYSMSQPIVDMTLVKLLPFSIFNIKL